MSDFAKVVQILAVEALQTRKLFKEHLPVRNLTDLLDAIQRARDTEVDGWFEVQQYLVNRAEVIGHPEVIPIEWLLRI